MCVPAVLGRRLPWLLEAWGRVALMLFLLLMLASSVSSSSPLSSPPAPVSPAPDQYHAPTPSSTPPSPVLHHIGCSFKVSNFTDYAFRFIHALERAEAGQPVDPATGRARIRYESVPLAAYSNAHDWLVYICDAVGHNNITVFFAVGSQDMINTLSIVTRYVGIPIIGYVTQRETAPITVSIFFHISLILCTILEVLHKLY